MKIISAHKIKVFILLGLFLVIIYLCFVTSDLRRQVDRYETQKTQQDSLLIGTDKVRGYSCGVLSENRAKDILGSRAVLQQYGQGSTDKIQQSKEKQAKIFWTDSCRYEDAENNAKYVELYISTFDANEDAAKAFPDFFKTVNDNEALSSGLGQSLVYDNGVYYLLSQNKVVQVSASNGIPSETREFSRTVFERLLN